MVVERNKHGVRNQIKVGNSNEKLSQVTCDTGFKGQ